ncbi:MAG: ATP-grasp domain-containing protein, partial [Muribaculaceae bacterium]|nr:ATP-grasp domain-containing protein [Muribaculaceae bacterium]
MIAQGKPNAEALAPEDIPNPFAEVESMENRGERLLKPLNILFLGGAKRVSIGRMFLDAALRLGYRGNLFSYELDKEVPLAEIATIVPGLRWSDPQLMDDLRRVCTTYAIDIIVPFVDPAVEVAARLDGFRRADKAVTRSATHTDPAAVARIFDKVEANTLFLASGLPVPKDYPMRGAFFPMIAKPRFGSASQGIMILNRPTELADIPNQEDYLIQEYVAKREEYTVDCYVSRADGEVVCAVPRRRLAVVGGEVSSTVTFRDDAVESLTRRTLAHTGLRGPVTVQLLRDTTDGRLMLMEIN